MSGTLHITPKGTKEMQEFWDSLPTKLKSALYLKNRYLILSSDEVPLQPVNPSRLKALPKYYLFNDAFVTLQSTMLTESPLEWIWIEHVIGSDCMQLTIQQMTCFRMILPEQTLDFQCKEFMHKSKWINCLVDAIGVALHIPQFVSKRGDLTLDTQLELLRGRDFMTYTFRMIPELKDARIKGQWVNAKPHGICEYWHEPSGKLYKGGFKKGRFHGQGELLWFADHEQRKKYIGEFVDGEMEGQGEMKYSNGDVYEGRWIQGRRQGFGCVEEASRKNSTYCGGWVDDKRHGYGVYDDKMKHERYLGMWSENQRYGPGIIITSAGTYSEATFINGQIVAGNDGLILDPNGSSFMGKIGPDFRLAGKGLLTLVNGVEMEGTFSGPWHGELEIQRGTLNPHNGDKDQTDGTLIRSLSELQIAKLDGRIGMCTVLASNKWQPIYEECETALGFSGNAASDVLTAWTRIASNAYEQRQQHLHPLSSSTGSPHLLDVTNPIRRAHSLSVLHTAPPTKTSPKTTVRAPGELISLARARAQTIHERSHEDSPAPPRSSSVLDFEMSIRELEKSLRLSTGQKITISGPLHLKEEEAASSYSPVSTLESMYSPRSDNSPVSTSGRYFQSFHEEEGKEEEAGVHHDGPEESEDTATTVRASEAETRQGQVSFEQQESAASLSGQINTATAIQRYIDKAFNTPTHPLGVMMNRLESVFRDSYGGIGANKFLLPHAIAEVQYICKRLHGIIRILFPFLDDNNMEITSIGFTRVTGSDPDDYLCIDSGYNLLHPLVFQRLSSTLLMLYKLHHAEGNRQYQHGIEVLSQMNNDRLVHFIHLPQEVCSKITSSRETNGINILGDLEQAAALLRKINTLFTPGEFLDLFKAAFNQISNLQQLSGDILLPAVVFIVVRACVPHLSAYLHFLMDFAHTQPPDEYTLVTYEAAYNFIRKQSNRSALS